MKLSITAALLSLTVSAGAELRDAKELMKQNQPAKAGAVIQQLLQSKPDDLWLRYDAGVAAYATKDFEQADKVWQELAAKPLPDKLHDKVWTQIGNVSFRRGEDLVAATPELALPHWEQSREALRVAVNSDKRNKLAQNNLTYVENELAKLHIKLAKRLIQEAQKKEWDIKKPIEKLQAALDHQNAAQNLQPKNEELKKDIKKTEAMLAEKFTQKATDEEKQADKGLDKPNPQQWDRKMAEEKLNTALADFQEAKQLNPENKPAEEGEKRVQEKLANLLTQQAQKLAEDARAEKNYNPEDAINKFEKALDKFEEALNHNPNQEQAKAGEEQVKKELEQLHVEQGDHLAQLGERDAKPRPAQAAEEKLGALQNYEDAKALNPDNQEVPPKITALQKELPELLMALGQREQAKADQAEAKSPDQAVQHLEKAATAYEMAQDLQKNNQAAQQAEEKVQAQLAKLRAQLAAKAQAEAQQQAKKSEKEQDTETFESMLAKVKNDDKQKQFEQTRRNPQEKYDPEKVKAYKNW